MKISYFTFFHKYLLKSVHSIVQIDIIDRLCVVNTIGYLLSNFQFDIFLLEINTKSDSMKNNIYFPSIYFLFKTIFPFWSHFWHLMNSAPSFSCYYNVSSLSVELLSVFNLTCRSLCSLCIDRDKKIKIQKNEIFIVSLCDLSE